MTYYRDPLLDTICDRIAGFDRPAYVKNSELVFVAANHAFAQLFNLSSAQLTGTSSADHAELDTLIDLFDKERACVVFGEDQRANYADPFGRGRFAAMMERFTLADGQSFIYCVFEDHGWAGKAGNDKVGALPPAATEPPVHAAAEKLPSASSGASVELYRALLDSLPVPTFLRGDDHRLVFVNRAFSELVGVSVADLIGSTEFDLYGPRGPEVFEMNRAMLEGGQDVQREFDMPVAGGKSMPSILKTSRLLGDDGTRYVVGTITDISAIRQREDQLRRAGEAAQAAREDFENILASVDVGLIVLDRDFKITLANGSYIRRIWPRSGSRLPTPVGMDYKSFIRSFFESGVRPIDMDSFERYYRDRVGEISSGRIKPREIVYEEGSVIFYSGVPLSDDRFMLCYLDLTELRAQSMEVAKARKAAEDSYQLVVSATDTMPEGLMVLEGENIILTNRCLAELINVPEEMLAPGCHWEDVYRATAKQDPNYNEEKTENSLQRFREAIREQKNVAYNFPLDGERWIHLEMRPKENGRTVLLCTDQTDIRRREGELKRLIRKAEAADRAKSEFLANMSHEIRTPMNGILGMAELLARDPLDARQKTFVDVIVKSGGALLTIINDILDFSRLDAGQMQIKPAPFNPHEAIEDVAALLASRAAEKDIGLFVRRANPLPATINGDAGRFRQIVTNLIGNAIKFTESGHITATIGVANGAGGSRIVQVSVEDTGIGIPEEKQQSIFEQFSQVDGSYARRHEGTGLGLAISQRLARLHGGDISVRSEEGKGSTFTLWLPVDADAELVRMPSLPVSVKGSRVLIIDPNPVGSSILMEQVTDWGFEGVVVPDGATGLEILSAAYDQGIVVDAVLIDSQLPDMTSTELIEAIRRMPAGDGSALIVLASVRSGDLGTAMGVGLVQAQLMKPIRCVILRETIIAAIGDMRLKHRREMVRPAPARADISQRSAPTTEPLHPALRPARPSAHAGQILIAEDNEVNRIVFSQILQGSGHPFRIVENGMEAVEAWLQHGPSLVIMDVSMPIMDGLQATQRIRELEAESGGHTPIIGVTAHALGGDRERCLSAGMDDYITKPISPERLEEKIRHWASGPAREAGRG